MKDPIKISPIARRKQEAYATEFERRWRLRAVKLPGFLAEVYGDFCFARCVNLRELAELREEVAEEMEDWDVRI